MAVAKAKKPARKTAKATKTVAKKKAPAKKAVKKTTKKTVVKPEVKVKAITTKQTKVQILKAIAEDTNLSKKEVEAVFKSLGQMVHGAVKKRGCGEFTIPETGVKIRRVRKPATKKRKMISPFTGEEITVAAKPARNTVKVAALKALKEWAL